MTLLSKLGRNGAIKSPVARAAGALALVIAGAVGINEGRQLSAYQDSAGVWTICDGHTGGVQRGDVATPAQCDVLLKQGIQAHARALQGLPDSTPDAVIVGAVDLTYNIGESGFNNSTVKRCLMKEDYTCASKAVLQWKYITRNGKKYDCSAPGNKVCSGLWKRRLWQADVIGNKYKTPEAALAALPK